MRFYKPLASWMHPAGTFSSIQSAFLKMFSMCPITCLCFLIISCVGRPWVSKLHPQGLFPSCNLHSWKIRACFFPAGCRRKHDSVDSSQYLLAESSSPHESVDTLKLTRVICPEQGHPAHPILNFDSKSTFFNIVLKQTSNFLMIWAENCLSHTAATRRI